MTRSDLSIRPLPIFLAAVALSLAAQPATLAAQTSREVVQPLPAEEVQQLNRALMELARNPRSVTAMLNAGDASLSVGDYDAAAGFYGRAADLAPNDPRTKLGLGRVYLRSGQPLEAIPMFNAARSSGAEPRDILSDQALAFDMIGDQQAAQAAYARAIEINPQDDEARRRLALSQAISANEAGFQETLAPLLEARDPAAFRTRAFGLAILDQQDRAAAIVNEVMPRDLAARINPYLAYMPRLTPSQQAAAANLGIFPRAADIGREDPRIARFASESTVGSLLEPTGEPLGAPVETVSQEVTQEVSAPAEVAASSVSASETLPDITTSEVSEEVVPETIEQVAQVTPEPEPEAVSVPLSVADAFADLGENSDLPVEGSASGAVDLAAIEIPRESAPEPEPEPQEPDHPSRIWVQLATGRDVSALGFDWRRFSRRAPDLLGDFEPHVTPWGQANRLLAGPVESRAAARALINGLSEKGIETFSYTSPEGTEIQKLN